MKLQQQMGYEEMRIREKLQVNRQIGLGDEEDGYLIKKGEKVIRRIQLERIMSSVNDGFR